jgi:tRNA dimethylallyltransferase
MKKIICIVGPTGVGKTKLSIELAKYLNTEIINSDAMQVYKRLNIGTAKATPDEQEGIKHHLLDFKEVDDSYSIYEYQQDVRHKIDEFYSNGKIPILIGGSGHYLKSVLYDYTFDNEDSEKTEEAKMKYQNYTNEELYERLKEVDVESTEILHQNNRKRVLRAVIYFDIHGKKKSQNVAEQKQEPLYDAFIIGLTTDREVLYDRINKRVDIMVENGLLEEVKSIYEDGYDVFLQSLRSIGYKELFPYFEEKSSLESCLNAIKKNSRNYAKRQYTYFNNQLNVNWFNVNFNDFNETVSEIMQKVDDFIEE